mgnify:CR=1 FL=1
MVRDYDPANNYNNLLDRMIRHRDAIISHLNWVCIFLGFHSFGLYIHNDTLSALGRPADMFSDTAIQLQPVFAQWIQKTHAVAPGFTAPNALASTSPSWGGDVVAVGNKVAMMPIALGTSDFMVYLMGHVKFRYMLELPKYERVRKIRTGKISLLGLISRKALKIQTVRFNYTRSSETIREILINQQKMIKKQMSKIQRYQQTNKLTASDCCFKSYIQFGLCEHLKKPDIQFLEWFIGFFEAEGSFTSWLDGKKKRVQVEITQKDPKLMYKIKKSLGFGNVTSYKKDHSQQTYWRYQTSKKEMLIRLIYLFNNNLITDQKFQKFQNFILKFNQIHNTNFVPIKNSHKISLNSAWLSGFLEGDGGFWATLLQPQIKRTQLKTGLKIKFYITQKEEFVLLHQIKKLFEISSELNPKLTNGHTLIKYNRLETSNLKSLTKIRTYLETFKFYGQRQILLKRWCRLIDYKIKTYPYTKKSWIKLKRLVLATKNHSKTKLTH